MAKSRKSNRSSSKAKNSADATDTVEQGTSVEETVLAETPLEETIEADASETVDTPADETVAAADEVIEGTAEEIEPEETVDADLAQSDDTVAAEESSVEGAQGDDTLLSEDENATDDDRLVSETGADTSDPADAEISNDTVEPEPEKTSPPTPAVVAQPAQPTGSIWPGVFGGVIAAMIGFIVGRGDALDDYLPSAFQRQTTDLSALEEQTADLASADAELAERLATLEQLDNSELEARLAALEGTDNSDLNDRIAAIESADTSELVGTIAVLEASVADLTARLAAVEDMPAPEPTVEGPTTDEFVELQSALEAQRAEIAALAERAEDAEANAASEAAKILARAALTRVVTAVDSGETFGPALGDLEQVTPVEVPEALRTVADSGVPTMSELRETFPGAARAGLAAARSEVPESDVQGITGFLKRQLSARSVTPREGDDPDAVLSRAEAAVRAGDLTTALTEMETLPDPARAAMDDWLQAATARKAAQDAANALADSLNSN